MKYVNHEFLEKIKAIAVEAGQLTLNYRNQKLVAIKKDSSPLTAADLAAHQCIMTRLLELEPSIPIISEEAPVPKYDIRKLWPRFWLIDPLDGTKEFLLKTATNLP